MGQTKGSHLDGGVGLPINIRCRFVKGEDGSVLGKRIHS